MNGPTNGLMNGLGQPAPTPPSPTSAAIKTIIFDLMGTCTNWHIAVTMALEAQVPRSPDDSESKVTEDCRYIALDWRKAFFQEIHRRFQAGDPQEDIDETHRRTLQMVLDSPEWAHRNFFHADGNAVQEVVQAWHDQVAWIDVEHALPKLRESFDV